MDHFSQHFSLPGSAMSLINLVLSGPIQPGRGAEEMPILYYWRVDTAWSNMSKFFQEFLSLM